jgi:hypothetical protein
VASKNQEPTLMSLQVPHYQAVLIINENFRIGTQTKKPNIFWRFWQYALLGWRWEDM